MKRATVLVTSERFKAGQAIVDDAAVAAKEACTFVDPQRLDRMVQEKSAELVVPRAPIAAGPSSPPEHFDAPGPRLDVPAGSAQDELEHETDQHETKEP